MATVNIQLGDIGDRWTGACRKAAADLNALFRRNEIGVVFSIGGTGGPTITVATDPAILGSAVHGRNTTTTDGSGRLISSEVRLPVSVTINTPAGVRNAGPGFLEVIAAHEFVHALGHPSHNSHLMARTFSKLAGDTAAGDKLQAAAISLPPLSLATESIVELKRLWP